MNPDVIPTVSATVVLYNSADTLPELLRSIRRPVLDGFAELIVVDNASPDDGLQLVCDMAPAARIVRAPHNGGFAAGANLAWPHVRGRYWMLLNPDLILSADDLSQLVRWMEAHPEIGIASPELVDIDGDRRHPGRPFPSIALALLELTRLHKLLPASAQAALLKGPYWRRGDQLNVGWVPGTAAIVRREAVIGVGLLSEEFFMYGEDIEWCARFRAAGWKVGVCSQVTLRHHGGTSTRRTWDSEATERRMAAATVQAIRTCRGPLYARVYRRIAIAALWLEAHHPQRSEAYRASKRLTLDAWSSLPVR